MATKKKNIKAIQKNWKEKLLMFAVQHTKMQQFMSLSEFEEEIDRLRIIRKGLSKYESGRELEFPKFITNFIILNNIFPVYVLNQLLFAEVPESSWKSLKTILSWLGILVEDKILRLPTDPIVTIRLNSLNISKRLIKDLNDVVSEKYIVGSN